MQLNISKWGASLFVGWLVWLAYLGATDSGAFWIALVFQPVFGLITWPAIRSRNIVLQAFSVFMFIAQAIGAPFFWMNQANYTAGFASVGSFSFDLAEFFLIYIWVAAIYTLLVGSVCKLDKYLWGKNRIVSEFLQQRKYSVPTSQTRRSGIAFDAMIAGIIVLILVPLNVYMAVNNIGTLGLLNEPLPFHLTGIMYFTRLYLGPLLILVLFAKSTRSGLLVATILAYAFMAGISSASRSVFLISLFSVGYFAIIDRQKARLIGISVWGLIGFLLTSGSREFTYSGVDFEYGNALAVAFEVAFSGQVSIIDIIGGISNRLYGAQDFVLSYQFVRDDTWSAMVNFFLMGGRSDTIVPNLARDLYDMNLDNTGFGVAIGTLAYFLILSHSNILVAPFAIITLAFLISAGNQLLSYTLAKIATIKLISYQVARGPIRIMLGGFMAFSLYNSSLNLFYSLVGYLLILLFAHYLFISLKYSGKTDA